LPVAWFIGPYKRRDLPIGPGRYAAIEDFAAAIRADAGAYAYTEILGDAALAKVRASDPTLTAINNTAGFVRIPNHFDLADTLGDLTAAQRTGIVNRLLALGYPQAEIDAALPASWQAVTLGQVLRFAARRRLRPRVDQATNTIVLDGTVQPVTPVELVDAAVPAAVQAVTFGAATFGVGKFGGG
jgi:hypothetical protein